MVGWGGIEPSHPTNFSVWLKSRRIYPFYIKENVISRLGMDTFQKKNLEHIDSTWNVRLTVGTGS